MTNFDKLIGGKKKNNNMMIMIVLVVICCCYSCCCSMSSIGSGIGAYLHSENTKKGGTGAPTDDPLLDTAMAS